MSSTVIVERSRPSDLTTPRLIRCLLSRSHLTHLHTALKCIFRVQHRLFVLLPLLSRCFLMNQGWCLDLLSDQTNCMLEADWSQHSYICVHVSLTSCSKKNPIKRQHQKNTMILLRSHFIESLLLVTSPCNRA